jgi:hypothetical protein
MINNTFFEGNSVEATGRGGAIAVMGEAYLYGVSFKKNYAIGSRGSDIFVFGGYVSWVGGESVGIGGELSLENNNGGATTGYQTSSGGSVGLGGGVEIDIDGVSFSSARVYFNGGVVLADGGSIATLNNCYINDTAGLRTGAIAAVRFSGRSWMGIQAAFQTTTLTL